MASIDIDSARLVPAPGADGWLCRLHGAVVWLPGPHGGELIDECIASPGPTELLGRIASRLADPEAPAWPPFAIVAARGAEVVVVVHGPVEVTVATDGAETQLYGGEGVGSWLNRVLTDCHGLRAGNPASDEGPADLREGVVQAGGFLMAAGAPGTARPGLPSGEHNPSRVGAAEAGPARDGASASEPLRSMSSSKSMPSNKASALWHQGSGTAGAPTEAATSGKEGAAARRSDVLRAAPMGGWLGDDPTVLGASSVGGDVTVIEVAGDGSSESAGRGGSAGTGGRGRAAPGRLTWDNGETHELAGAMLVGRDVGNDPAVMAGQLAPLVPTGQNDSMSRVHAELRPRDAELMVVDRGSTNGTFIWDDDSRGWRRLTAGEPEVVPAGAVLAFGERTATFEAVAAQVRGGARKAR